MTSLARSAERSSLRGRGHAGGEGEGKGEGESPGEGETSERDARPAGGAGEAAGPRAGVAVRRAAEGVVGAASGAAACTLCSGVAESTAAPVTIAGRDNTSIRTTLSADEKRARTETAPGRRRYGAARADLPTLVNLPHITAALLMTGPRCLGLDCKDNHPAGTDARQNMQIMPHPTGRCKRSIVPHLT